MSVDDVMTLAATTSRTLFEVPAVVLLIGDDGEAVSTSKSGDAELREADLQAARSLLTSGVVSRAGVYPDLASRFDSWPVQTSSGPKAIIGLVFGPDERPAAPETATDVVASLFSLALDRLYPSRR